MPKNRMLWFVVCAVMLCIFAASLSSSAVARSQQDQVASAQVVQLKKVKLSLHKSKSVVRFWNNKGHWALFSRTERCLELGPAKHELICKMARRSLQVHSKRIKIAERKLTKLKEASLPVGSLANWICIHDGEGAWNSNTGNGYYGGLQMDLTFQRTYGAEFLARYGTANNWPIRVQLAVAQRAHDGYAGHRARGYGPWPNTGRECGLIG